MLTKEELDIFNDEPTAPPAVRPESGHGVGDQFGGSDFEVQKPAPALERHNVYRQLIIPPCADCGVDLNPENGSERNGIWKHIGCPKKVTAQSAAVSAQSTVTPGEVPGGQPPPAPVLETRVNGHTVLVASAAVIPPDAPPNDPNAPPPAKRGRKPKTESATPAPAAAVATATPAPAPDPEQPQINKIVEILADAAIYKQPPASVTQVIRFEFGLDADTKAILRALIK